MHAGQPEARLLKWTQRWSHSTQTIVGVGLIARLCFLLVGMWLDSDVLGLGLRYTDVDYDVFSEASAAVWHGGSPYERATYRYPPLLALLLVPNHALGLSIWGKFLFLVADALMSSCIYEIVLERDFPAAAPLVALRGTNVISSDTDDDSDNCSDMSEAPDIKVRDRKVKVERRARFWAVLWAVNPLTAVISTRGSSDSLSNLLVLLALRGVLRGRRMKSLYMLAGAGMALGLAVHMRLYPVIYGLAFCLYLLPHQQSRTRLQAATVTTYKETVRRFLTGPVCVFATAAAATCIYFTVASHLMCPTDFLPNAVLYHGTRQDHRHNFSVRFLDVYLSKSAEAYALADGIGDASDSASASASASGVDPEPADVGSIGVGNIDILAVLAHVLHKVASSFAIQALIVVAASLSLARRNLCVCLLVLTMCFVCFNAVVTAQYFTWYLCLLPVAVPEHVISLFDGSTGNGDGEGDGHGHGNGHGNGNGTYEAIQKQRRHHRWLLVAGFLNVFCCVCLWLQRAYALEILGQSVHKQVWACSMLLHLSQVVAIVLVVKLFVRESSSSDRSSDSNCLTENRIRESDSMEKEKEKKK